MLLTLGFFLVFRLFAQLLTIVQVTLLTTYDMHKAVDRGTVMGDVKLAENSGEWKAGE